MTRPLNDTPVQDFVIHIGAPKNIVMQIRQGSGGVLRAFSGSVVMRVTHPAGVFDLAVGTGVTLSSAEGVANALFTAQLSVSQSRLIPLGSRSRFEIQDTVAGVQSVVLMGSLIGKGGGNPDV